jgi:2-dehydropantoate 2-reductase
MNITILGAGALGGYFGGRLVENGAHVTFLVRPARKALLDAHGLRIESPLGSTTLRVESRTAQTITPDADLVLLTCKAYDLDAAIESIKPAMAAHTAVLPILNGLAHIDRLITVFGQDRIIGGLAKIQATLGQDGTILHLNDWNEIIFGELDGRVSGRVTALHALFAKPKVNAQIATDMRMELWKKLVHLSTVAAVTTLTRQSLGVVNMAADGRWLIETTLESAAKIAAAEGYAMSDAYMAGYRKTFAGAGNAYKASMLRDMEKGGRAEGEHILGFMRDLAAKHAIDASVFRIAAANVQAYDVGRGV